MLEAQYPTFLEPPSSQIPCCSHICRGVRISKRGTKKRMRSGYIMFRKSWPAMKSAWTSTCWFWSQHAFPSVLSVPWSKYLFSTNNQGYHYDDAPGIWWRDPCTRQTNSMYLHNEVFTLRRCTLRTISPYQGQSGILRDWLELWAHAMERLDIEKEDLLVRIQDSWEVSF